MLYFNQNNIFSYKNTINTQLVGFNASQTKLIPFQFKLSVEDSIIADMGTFKLINGNLEIDLSADNDLFEIYSDTNYYYVIFNGQTTLTSVISNGVWQLQVSIDLINDIDEITEYVFYSNFFNILCDNDIVATYTYYNSLDLENTIFQNGYKNFIYIDSKIAISDPFYKETITEKANGDNIYEQQVKALGYTFAIFGDNYLVKMLKQLDLCDTHEFTFQEYENETVFKRPELDFSILLNYNQVDITFYIEELNKLQCNTDKNLTEITQINFLIDQDNNYLTDQENNFLIY